MKKGSWKDYLVALGLLPWLFLVGGAVIRSMWGWFAVPALGVDPLSLRNAMGIGLLLGGARGIVIDRSDPGQPHYLSLVWGIFGTLFLWGIAWLLHLIP